MKATLKQALKDETRRSAILKSIGAEIDNLEGSGVLKLVSYAFEGANKALAGKSLKKEESKATSDNI